MNVIMNLIPEDLPNKMLVLLLTTLTTTIITLADSTAFSNDSTLPSSNKDQKTYFPSALKDLMNTHSLFQGDDFGELFAEFKILEQEKVENDPTKYLESNNLNHPKCLPVDIRKAQEIMTFFFEEIRRDIQSRLNIQTFSKINITEEVKNIVALDVSNDKPWSYCEKKEEFYGQSHFFTLSNEESLLFFFHLGHPD